MKSKTAVNFILGRLKTKLSKEFKATTGEFLLAKIFIFNMNTPEEKGCFSFNAELEKSDYNELLPDEIKNLKTLLPPTDEPIKNISAELDFIGKKIILRGEMVSGKKEIKTLSGS